jgi:hypothetical protein
MGSPLSPPPASAADDIQARLLEKKRHLQQVYDVLVKLNTGALTQAERLALEHEKTLLLTPTVASALKLKQAELEHLKSRKSPPDPEVLAGENNEAAIMADKIILLAALSDLEQQLIANPNAASITQQIADVTGQLAAKEMALKQQQVAVLRRKISLAHHAETLQNLLVGELHEVAMLRQLQTLTCKIQEITLQIFDPGDHATSYPSLFKSLVETQVKSIELQLEMKQENIHQLDLRLKPDVNMDSLRME